MNNTSRVLLFGDDGSPCADRAWLWINAQPWPGFEAHVLTCETERNDLTSDEMLPVRRWDPPRPRSAFSEATFDSVAHLHSTAAPGALLPTLTPDLLVIGPCGKGALRRLALGSTAETMIARSTAPVVIARGTNKARAIAVCIDGSETSLSAARFLTTLPLFEQAQRLYVVGVDPVDGRPEAEAEALSEVADQLGGKAETRVLLTESTPADAIVRLVQDDQCDLVVVGKSGRGTLERALVGSTAASLARSAPVPVLIVPPV